VTAILAGSAALSPAAAASQPVDIALLSSIDTQIQFAICVTSTSSLPGRLEGDYTVTHAGAGITAGTFTPGDPETLLRDIDPCPTPHLVVAVNNLTPGTTYTIDVTGTLTPKTENVDGDVIDDPARPVVSGSATLSVTTPRTAPPSATDEATTSDAAGPVGSSATPASGGASATGNSPAVNDVAPITIAHPTAFGPNDLAALTPAQVATIKPSVLSRIPPRTFAALTPAQAAALTPQQVNAIRPARARWITPRAIAALQPSALAVMRPASTRAIKTRAIAALTRRQLTALAPRQVRALSARQLAALTPSEQRLLHHEA
jgi:hypothetical protein